jgi:hypothetical protein
MHHLPSSNGSTPAFLIDILGLHVELAGEILLELVAYTPDTSGATRASPVSSSRENFCANPRPKTDSRWTNALLRMSPFTGYRSATDHAVDGRRARRLACCADR